MDQNKQINVFKHMLSRLEKLFFLHNYSADYFKKQSTGIKVPSIVITGLSSIASFLATSDIMTSEAKTGLTITVGCLTVLSTMMQSFSSAFKFNAKVESHLVAAAQYDTLLTKVKFEQINPNEKQQDFFDHLEKEILDIKNKCNYFFPKEVLEQWKKNKKKNKNKNGQNKGNNDSKNKGNNGKGKNGQNKGNNEKGENSEDGIELNGIKVEKNI